MKICPKCLNIYPEMWHNFCRLDGVILVLDYSREGQEAINSLKMIPFPLDGEKVTK